MKGEPVMKRRSLLRCGLLRSGLTLTLLAVLAGPCLPVYGAEHITLRNGFEFDCARREVAGDRVRLYLLPAAGALLPAVGALLPAVGALLPSARAGAAGQGVEEDANYIEVAASAVLRVEKIPDPPSLVPVAAPLALPLVLLEPARTASSPLTPAEMGQMLAQAGARHNIDADLLASVVEAESNGNALAVSRAGAQGLMQLMPATASELGVRNSFAPEQNIGGGTAYLDALLTRYHDDIALAAAAYNAGPAAVDRYHGIPPYAETRAYVARVIREFNRRKRAAQAAHASVMADAK
jgi:soluble lytic murein transglycosylase-like protein